MCVSVCVLGGRVCVCVCVCVCVVWPLCRAVRACVWGGGGVVWGGGAGRDVSVCVWACVCGVWAETEAERHSQAKDNAVCVCRGCVCVCGGEAVCGVLCGMWGRVRVCCGGGGGGWVGVWCIGATRGRVRHMGVCVAAETEAGRPSQAKDNGVCVCPGCVCVCVCVDGRVCVWGGMHVVCGQRHRHRITQPGKGQHCVCARVCVYVCVHTRMCVAWAGCLCVGGGGGA